MLTSPPPWLHEIDHTGDVGLRITAHTLTQLFDRAAAGTLHVLTDPGDVRAQTDTPSRSRGATARH
ncbi:MAG: hypothetical protein BRD55_03985 [Bacteroidetes bacterium SW_9_63_38]|nr:MAG: hypothetical protein BRD55_03985 [Bacteroidetes bacterium SW_9_63_38]